MFTTIANLDRGMASQLIRKSEDTRYVVIHADPNSDENLLKYPWTYQGFSLRPGMIAQAWKQAEKDGSLDPDLLPWIAMEARATETESIIEDGVGQSSPRYTWRQLNSPDEVYSATIALALHPHFANYTTERGLILGEIRERAGPPNTSPEKQNRGGYEAYTLESYAQHINGLHTAYAREHHTEVWRQGKRVTVHRPALRDEIAYTLRRIEQSPRFGFRPGLMDEVIRLMLALHDIGKLSVNWQAFAHEWQAAVGNSIAADFMAAHTDYDGSDEAQRELNKAIQRKTPRGNHAGEGAVASIPLLLSVCQQTEQAENGNRLFRAAVTAIARHHTPKVKDYSPFRFDAAAQSAMTEALEAVGLENLAPGLGEGIRWDVQDDKYSLPGHLIRTQARYNREILLYIILCRVLRIADQRSFFIRGNP
jgi:CRISPR-associated endonuclease/helicase Cas3